MLRSPSWRPRNRGPPGETFACACVASAAERGASGSLRVCMRCLRFRRGTESSLESVFGASAGGSQRAPALAEAGPSARLQRLARCSVLLDELLFSQLERPGKAPIQRSSCCRDPPGALPRSRRDNHDQCSNAAPPVLPCGLAGLRLSPCRPRPRLPRQSVRQRCKQRDGRHGSARLGRRAEPHVCHGWPRWLGRRIA
jgi:hypothetical protein